MNRRLSLWVCAAALMAVAGAAQATSVYVTTLEGPSESPPNASPGSGSAKVVYDPVLHTLNVHVDFSGLLGPTTASHIHAPTASPGTGTVGVATTLPTFPGFPLGVTSGTYDNTLDLTLASSFNAAYLTANGGTAASAEAALITSLDDGTAYLNVHTQVFPGGEIRGFLTSAPVPEPITAACVLASVAAVGGYVRKRARR